MRRHHAVLILGPSSASVLHLARVLEPAGFDVTVTTDCQHVTDRRYQLLVVDVAATSTEDVVRQLRADDAAVGILAIGSTRDPLMISTLLNQGADDYVPHQSSNAILVARTRAVLRRVVGEPYRPQATRKPSRTPT